MSLPIGWNDRNTQMSEKDLKLGGMAASKFASKNSYDGAQSAVYLSSDQVRDYYLNKLQQTSEEERSRASSSAPGLSESSSPATTCSSNVPDFWESRQKEKSVQSRQMGVFARHALNTQEPRQRFPSNPSVAPSATSTTTALHQGPMMMRGPISGSTAAGRNSLSLEVALIQIATNALDTMATALEHNNQADIPMQERAAFADAVKRAMAVLAKQSN